LNNSHTITGAAADRHVVLSLEAGYPRLLFVDDRELIRDTICSILARRASGCKSSADGREALQWLDTCIDTIDLLITGQQLPRMNGLEFLRKAQAMAFTGRILFRSAMLPGGERAACGEPATDAILPKTGGQDFLLPTGETLRRDK
jgi:DNA-binding response OmpR family regulator